MTTKRVRAPAITATVLGTLAVAATAIAQAPSEPDRLAPITALVGRWTGTTEGQPGTESTRPRPAAA